MDVSEWEGYVTMSKLKKDKRKDVLSLRHPEYVLKRVTRALELQVTENALTTIVEHGMNPPLKINRFLNEDETRRYEQENLHPNHTFRTCLL